MSSGAPGRCPESPSKSNNSGNSGNGEISPFTFSSSCLGIEGPGMFFNFDDAARSLYFRDLARSADEKQKKLLSKHAKKPYFTPQAAVSVDANCEKAQAAKNSQDSDHQYMENNAAPPVDITGDCANIFTV